MRVIDTSVRMRDDLALNKYQIPAWVQLSEPEVYLGAKDLEGAHYLPDLCSDDAEEYNYNRVRLADGRVFLILGVDLDFGGKHED